MTRGRWLALGAELPLAAAALLVTWAQATSPAGLQGRWLHVALLLAPLHLLRGAAALGLARVAPAALAVGALAEAGALAGAASSPVAPSALLAAALAAVAAATPGPVDSPAEAGDEPRAARVLVPALGALALLAAALLALRELLAGLPLAGARFVLTLVALAEALRPGAPRGVDDGVRRVAAGVALAGTGWALLGERGSGWTRFVEDVVAAGWSGAAWPGPLARRPLLVAACLAPPLATALAALAAWTRPAPWRARAALALTPALLAGTWAACLALRPARLDLAGERFPVLYAPAAVRADRPLGPLATFAPTFGADRPCVNPARPALGDDGRSLRLERPGEYYLRLDARTPLKVLVLDPAEPPSQQVLRLFEFCSANLVWADAQDPRFDADPEAFVDEWFASDEPGVLLCGPTCDLFRRLVHERLGLPTRLVTAPGLWVDAEGQRRFATHNVPEVHLPDLGRWGFFDVNHGFAPTWLDGPELARRLHAARGGAGPLTDAQWAALDLRVHPGPRPRALRSDVGGPGLLAGGFSPDQLDPRELQATWPGAYGAVFGGGVAYYGQGARHGTPFLPAEYVFGSLHEDAAWTAEALARAQGVGERRQALTLDELEALLRAHAPR